VFLDHPEGRQHSLGRQGDRLSPRVTWSTALSHHGTRNGLPMDRQLGLPKFDRPSAGAPWLYGFCGFFSFCADYHRQSSAIGHPNYGALTETRTPPTVHQREWQTQMRWRRPIADPPAYVQVGIRIFVSRRK
jgi:hypothetical protein